MELLELQTETGKSLHSILTNCTKKNNIEPVLDKIKRAFIGLSTELENEDRFIALLYGQQVLDESPLTLSQRVSVVFLRVQHGIETSLEKNCWKELLVALEQSKNENVLSRMSTWAEKNLKKEEVTVEKSLLSQLPSGSRTPRHREIKRTGKELECPVLEVCNNKIILGWDNGQIKIYNSDDLCQTTLNFCMDGGYVTCLQCTCTEIIAGYGNGSICLWDIAKGSPKQTFSIKNEREIRVDYPTCMRWTDPKLVVATQLGRVKIWNCLSSGLELLGGWETDVSPVDRVDFNENYVVHHSRGQPVEVKYFNGNPCRSISAPGDINCMSYYEGRVVTGGEDKILQIWDIETGACLIGLEGHKKNINAIDAHGDLIASVDDSGKSIIWSAKATLEGGQAKLASFDHATFDPEYETFDIKLGTSSFVINSRHPASISIRILGFPQ